MKKIKPGVSKKHLDQDTESQKYDLGPSFPVVGIGASAGGVDAFTQLLNKLPNNTGMAFVLIQHLDPTHKSLLTEVLSKFTQMPVQEIKDGLEIKPNQVYVIPPGSDTGLLRNKFTLIPREKTSQPHMAIDFFFRSLAENCGSHAIGVILTGTLNDGTEGLRAIKAENGVTLTQDPMSAKFSGMPQSAVNAAVADFCLPLVEISEELIRLARHPFISGSTPEPLLELEDTQVLQKIFVLLRASVGVDFSEYKLPTIKRRLARRMTLLKIDSFPDYLKFLQSKPEEIKLLASDVLIHVTSFFRNPEVFIKLQETIFPEILKYKALGTPIRIWVTACSSGEEVYSLAISLLEFLGARSSKFPIQVFGSDISERMIQKARKAFYTENIVSDIDPERLARFFVKVEGGYKISKLVRDLCVFVRHDLARDPPFSRLDLVTCRNVLIYFQPTLQKRIISTFHYCLNQPGYLLLGRAEGIAGFDRFFSTVDKTNRIFSREAVTSRLSFATMQNTPAQRQAFQPIVIEQKNSSTVDISKQVDSLLFRYAPAGVVINESMEVLQYRGQTSLYLEPPPGQPQLNLLKMVRKGLFATLKVAVDDAKKKNTVVRKENLHFKLHGVSRICNIVVSPLSKLPGSKELLFLVLFEEVSSPLKRGKQREEKESQKSARLGYELKSTQEYQQTLNDDHQKTNDELNSVNEELMTSNEELQSLNEELQTAKEELQSTNEELTTVNDEVQNRNHETAEINDDLINLLNSSDIPILILDLNRRIRRYTPKARSIMNLLPTDVGRQIDEIKPNIFIKNLDQQIQEVIETVTTKESEVQDRDGRWYRLQIRPYKTSDNRIAGTILSLIDIHRLRELLSETQEAKSNSDKANITKDIFLATLSHELRTPLTSLILQAQMLKRGLYDEAKVKKASIAIERAAQMQAQLIEDLLDVSRIVTGKLKIELKPVDFSKVVRAALETVSATAEGKAITIESSLEPSLGQVSGDIVRLQQVVWNLLTNAIKFTSKGDKVIVNLKATGGYAQLQVIDKGIGITPEFLPQVFKRFTQAEDTVTRTHGGLGLGLSIVRYLVEMHGGTVKVESPGIDKGATFTVMLPLINAASQMSTPQNLLLLTHSVNQSQKNQAEKLKGLRILVVEDDLGVQEALTGILTEAGVQVRASASAIDAMLVLKEFEPDVMVLDIAMPGEDGYSLLRRIRKLGPFNGKIIPAIALTALASDKDRQEAFSAGFQMHLTKPIDIDRLTGALLELVKQGHPVH